MSILPATRADIPWPEVVQRLADENAKLARRPQGHAGEYFIVCTLYYTPKESGFTFERGFDATRVTKSGLRGRAYPRDFLRSVKKEGYGRIVTPVNGHNYIRYNDGGSYSFSSAPSGGGGTLVARFSAAAKSQAGLYRGLVLEIAEQVGRGGAPGDGDAALALLIGYRDLVVEKIGSCPRRCRALRAHRRFQATQLTFEFARC